MKKIFQFSLLTISLLTGVAVNAQKDKSTRPSPPATVSETTADGVTITINYSQPSVKGRTIGKEIAPYGEVWRTGANEATTFEISDDVKIEGKVLPKGKYSIYSVPGATEWTFIFNKIWDQWGTKYTEADDALRVKVPTEINNASYEKMTFVVNREGRVTLWWGDKQVRFSVAKASK